MKIIKTIILTLPLVILSVSGCSKKEGDSSTQPKALASKEILADPLLQKLPDTTKGFIVMDFSGDGYEKFKNSPWASDVQGLSAIKAAVEELESHGASEDQIKLAKTLLDSLQKLGLVGQDGKSQVETVVSKTVGFVELQQSSKIPVSVGVFASAAQGADLSQKATTLRQILADTGLKITDATYGTASGFSAAPTEEQLPGAQNIAVHVAASPKVFGLSLSSSSLSTLFSDTSTKGLSNLQTLPEFSKVSASVNSPESPLSFAFISIKSFLPLLEQVQREADPEAQIDLTDFPVSALAVRQAFSKQLVTSAGVAVAPVTEVQKSVVSSFENPSLPSSAFRVPADTAFSLSFDTRALLKLQKALKDLADPSTEMAAQQLKDIQGVTLGLRNSDGSSPLPEIYLALESASREQVSSSLESLIGLGMMASGQQLQWLSKEVAGAPTKYFMTPLGVSVYLTSPKNSGAVIIASSERLVSDLATSANGGASLDKSLSPELRQRVSATTLGSLYLNFVNLASVMDTIKGTIASMVGPNPELDDALNTAKLKRFGVGIGSLSYADGVVTIKSAFERASEPLK